MPEYPYADNMYSSLDDSDVEDRDELYSVAAGLGLGDSSSYRPGGPTGQQQPQQHQHDQHQHTAEEEEALSPSDGYFGRSQPQFEESTPSAYPSDSYTSFQSQRQHRDQVPLNTSTPASIPRSSQVPHVPNVWVSDPSLSQESTDKANEAQQERSQYENNRRLAAADQHHLDPATPDHSSLTSPTAGASPGASNVLSPSLLPNSPQPATATRSAATASYVSSPRTAAHRYTPSNTSSSAAGPYHPRRTYSERSSLFSEAPPAYTPSPTSPTSNASGGTSNNYQTFSPTSRTAPGFSTMGRLSESESHGLLAGQNYNAIPQSMGGELDPNDDGHFEYPRPSGWRDRLRQFSWRRHWKLVLLGIVLTFVTLGFLVSSFLGVKNEKTIKFPGNPENRPVTDPGDKDPVEDDDGVRLEYPSYDGEPFADYNTRQCGDTKIQYNRMVFDLDFTPSRNISVFQDIKDDDGAYQGKDVRVQGEIVLRRAGNGTPTPSVVLETASNHDTIQYTLNWDDAEQRLYMLTPRTMPWSQSTTSPCLSIRATVWVPPRSVLNSLNVESVHLGIHLLDNLSLQLGEFARLASTVGHIVSATDGEKGKTELMHEQPPTSFALDSRYVEVKTMSAPITGAWPLYDYLGLQTISGSIYAGVTPKDALRDKPRPAILYVHSTSGTIEVFEPIAAAAAAHVAASQQAGGISSATTTTAESIIPARQYGVDLYSMSGNVKADVAFGSSCKVHTTSGHVDLTLLPVLDQAQADAASGAEASSSLLDTSTTSGTTNIHVLEPLWSHLASGTYVPLSTTSNIGARDPYDVVAARNDTPSTTAPDTQSSRPRALRALNGHHTATSATIHVAYPASWEGWIDGDSLTGKITVAGEGVEIIRRDEDFPGIKRHTLAHKGEDETQGGKLRVHTTSGSIGVMIGS